MFSSPVPWWCDLLLSLCVLHCRICWIHHQHTWSYVILSSSLTLHVKWKQILQDYSFSGSYQILMWIEYCITGNFCSVKFLRFLTKKKIFKFCGFFFWGLKISAPKKIICITGSNNWNDVTINNWYTLQWSLEVNTYLVFIGYSFWTRLISNLFKKLFSRCILLTGNTKSTVGSISL